tara:strand:- start:248 stop:1210 length:963 start_codon:yes stop_codon:yes gene_type:complete
MFKRKENKQNRLKRILLKLLNIEGFDKETFDIVNPNVDNVSKNFYKLNDKTYILSSGFLDLKRKIKQVDIYFRFNPSIALWNSSSEWKRVTPNIDKKILIKVCLISLKNSIISFLSKYKLKFNIHLIHDGSDNEFNDNLIKLLDNNKINIYLHKSKIDGNRGSFLECCDQVSKSEDLIFFIEDDYLFELDAIEEIIFTYSRISTLLNKDVFLCPSDYPFYYDSSYNTSLFIGKEYRWRYVGETLLTFIFSKEIFNNYKKKIRLVGENINDPFEKPLHNIFKEIPCLAPVKSLAYHLSRHVPAISEDWLSLWKKNYNQIIE